MQLKSILDKYDVIEAQVLYNKAVELLQLISDEELEEIFTKYEGYSWIHGSSDRFSVFVNDKTKDAITYWYRMRETTNLKDSQGNIVCVNDELIDNISKHKCWLLWCDDELYIRFDYFPTPMGCPDIEDIRDLSNFTITKRYSTF